tara:strand:+ start:281 stop:655 length:375 start_codon:yes stop_codon:yes gene_type:complete
MTYARDPESFAAATTRAIRSVGNDALARLTGRSASRLRQCANPMKHDALTIDAAMAADIAAFRAGAGVPHFEVYRRGLIAAGVLSPSSDARRSATLSAAIRTACRILLTAVDADRAGAPQALAA